MRLLTRRKFGGALAAGLTFVLSRRSVGAHDGAHHSVEIRRHKFEPARLTIRAGDAVDWTNFDLVPHTATASDKAWDTGKLARNESGMQIFDAPGTYRYFCLYHPAMKGEIVVE